MRSAILSITALGLAVGCAPSAKNEPKAAAKPLTVEQLTGEPWRVASVNGVAAQPAPTMQFGPDGRVSGNASCNQYSAAFKLDGAKLSFEQAISTMMACVDIDPETERRFLTTLAEVERAEIAADGSLVLHAKNDGRIIAKRG